MISEKSVGRFETCEFSSNALAGISLIESGKAVFQQCVLHEGRASGLTARKGAEGEFTDCEFTHHAGPALLISEKSEPRFERCHVRENRAVGRAGGRRVAGVHGLRDREERRDRLRLHAERDAAHDRGRDRREQRGAVRHLTGQKGRWERVQFFDNRGDTVLVSQEGRPALHLCHIEGRAGSGDCVFRRRARASSRDVDIVGSVGPGVEIEAGGQSRAQGGEGVARQRTWHCGPRRGCGPRGTLRFHGKRGRGLGRGPRRAAGARLVPVQPVFFRPPETPLMVSSMTARSSSASGVVLSARPRRRRIISTWM